MLLRGILLKFDLNGKKRIGGTGICFNISGTSSYGSFCRCEDQLGSHFMVILLNDIYLKGNASLHSENDSKFTSSQKRVHLFCA